MKSIGVLLMKILFPVWMVCICSTASSQGTSELPQFLFKDFVKGTVRKKSGVKEEYGINYNTITQRMVIEEENGLIDLPGIETVDTVTILNRKFIPFADGFCEVLLTAPFSLLHQHRNELVPAGMPAGYGSTSQTAAVNNYVGMSTRSGVLNFRIPDEYEIRNESFYWVINVSNKVRFKNRAQFLKVFDENREILESFIKKNRIKFENPDDVIRLISYYNEIIIR